MNKRIKRFLLISVSVLTLAGVGSGITSSTPSASTHVSLTSRIVRLKHKRASEYKSIKRINAELKRLKHQSKVSKSSRKVRKHYRRAHKTHHAIKRLTQRKRVIKRHVHTQTKVINTNPVHHAKKISHEPMYLYLKRHAKQMYNDNMNTNNMFAMGYNDASDNNMGNKPMSYHDDGTHGTGTLAEMTVLNPQYANDHDYKSGWLIGGATDSADAARDDDFGGQTNGSKADYKYIVNEYGQGLTYASNNKAKLVYLENGLWHNVADTAD